MIKTALKSLFRLPYLPLWAAPLILLLPVLAGKALFWGTGYLQFVPWRMEALRQLQQGILPLWNPLVGMGAPLAANYQSALFYPANWLLLLLGLAGAAWMAWGQALVVALHLALAGIGMARLAQRLGLNILGQSGAGLAFGLCGYLVARAGFLSINAAAAWVPWLVLCADRIASPLVPAPAPRPKLAIQLWPLALVSALLLLAGHAQTAFYALELAGFWLVFGALRQSGWRGLPRALGVFALGVSIGALVAGVQLAPTAEYLLQSQRSGGVDYDLAMNYSFFPLRLVTLIAPNLLGTPANGSYLLKADNYWEDAVYIGLLPLILALAAVWRSLGWRKQPRTGETAAQKKSTPYRALVIFLAVLALVTFVLAMGKNTPIFPFLYRFVPTFDMFQAPARYTLWAEFALALLAGIGASLWQRPVGKGRWGLLRGMAAAAALILGAAAAWPVLPADLRAIFVPPVALAGIIALLAGVLALRAPAPGSATPARWTAGVVLLICADLLIASWGIQPGAPVDLYSRSQNRVKISAELAGSRLYIGADDEGALKFNRFFRLNDFTAQEDWTNLRAVLLPNSGMLAGIPSANNFDPMLPGRYARFMEWLDQADGETQAYWLPRMDVALVESLDIYSATGVRFDPVSDAQHLRWECRAVGAANETDAWGKITAGETALILEGNGADFCDGAAAAALVEPETQQADDMTVKVTSSTSGWLVIADTWYPGWTAWVDGVEAPVLRANYLFRAVALPAGEHSVRFAYRPLSFTLGLAASLLGLLVSALLVGVARKSGRVKAQF